MPDPATLRVLVIDDDSTIRLLVSKLLENAGYRRITLTATAADGLAAAAEADLILLDHQLPDGTGVDLLPRLLGRVDPPSVVIVTGEGNETLAATALRAGAEDYLVKDQHLRDLLPQIVERVRRHRALRSAQSAVERELVEAERLAAVGELTVALHHEINNPLMAATAEVELLLVDKSLGDGPRESLELARDALFRIRDIVKRVGALQQTTSADYLAGLRMIDLSSAAAGRPAVPRGRALLWVPAENLARVTAMRLRHLGFTVERVDSARELAAGAARAGVTLCVVAVPGSDSADGALAGFAPAADRRYGVVALVDGDPTGARQAGANRVITIPIDPARIDDELLGALTDREPR